MPSLNQARFIEQAIDSILNQTYIYLELIVADGGSTDNTLEILSKKQQLDSRLKWFSGKDTGPANAINLALLQVKGTLIGWLNSDDLYTDGAIQRIVDAFYSQPYRLMIYGEADYIDEKGKVINHYPTLPPTVSIQQFTQGCFICQPSVFFQRSLFILLGRLDEGLKTAFDFDYWLRAFTAFPNRIGFINHLQAYSRLHQECITQRLRYIITLEGMKLLYKYLGYLPMNWVISYLNELVDNNSSEVVKKLDLLLSDLNFCISDNERVQLKILLKKDIRLGKFNLNRQ